MKLRRIDTTTYIKDCVNIIVDVVSGLTNTVELVMPRLLTVGTTEEIGTHTTTL